jgi:NADPH:quinone reductase-like Zn-dependent oxidoreductase
MDAIPDATAVVELAGGFGTGNLRRGERPLVPPGPGEVLIELSLATLNERDRLVIGGKRALELPLIPISDAVGIVAAAGDGAGLEVGARVSPIFMQGWRAGTLPRGGYATLGGPLDGVLRRHATFRADDVVEIPDGVSDELAAALPCAGVTAWHALFGAARLLPGEWVMVQGAGGLSLIALQLAHAAGARVAFVSSTAARLEIGRSLGAEVLVDYRKDPDWGRTVADATGGVDVVIDVAGGESIAQSVAALRPAGRLASCGVLTGGVVELDIEPIAFNGITYHGVRVGSREHHRALLQAVARNPIDPMVGAVFAATDLPAALERLGAPGRVGKVAVDLRSWD